MKNLALIQRWDTQKLEKAVRAIITYRDQCLGKELYHRRTGNQTGARLERSSAEVYDEAIQVLTEILMTGVKL